MPITSPAIELLRSPPQMRADPWARDVLDGQRCQWVRSLFHSQDDVRRPLEKSIEENIRMLCGQHYLLWNQVVGRWYDLSRYLSEAQQRWYYRPVVNWTLFWYVLTHARMTENSPVITFQPATLDRMDAILAEVMDPIWKRTWRLVEMDDINDQVAAWLLAAGEAFCMSVIDPTQGELQPWVGPAMLPLLDQFGQPMADETGQPVEEYVEEVPYDSQGNPLAQLVPDEQGGLGYEVTGEPHAEHAGEVDVRMLTPHQVRAEWGQTPWHKKRWHAFVSVEPVFDIEEKFGVRVTPDRGIDQPWGADLSDILMGSGHYAATSHRPGSESLITNFREGYKVVYTLYHRPTKLMPGTEETPDSPGGRRIICTKDECLYDGVREARFPYTSGIRRFQFIRIPGRPGGSTMQEALNPINRAYNKGQAQILLHRDRVSSPITLVDLDSGITKDDLTGEPGLTLAGRWRGKDDPVKLIQPARLSEQVYETQSQLLQDFKELGSLEGAQGSAPTSDSSGDLVEQLRFNSDRYLSSTQRRSVVEYSRMARDWIALHEVLIDRDRAISYAGQDQAVNTIMVWPVLFQQGQVNVVPDVESMFPEGRSQREAKVMALYREGAFGPPGTPMASSKLLEMFRFPHLGRAMVPGGVDAVTAAQENGQLALGVPAAQIPTFEWYDQLIHLLEHEKVMKSPEFKLMDPAVQAEFIFHRSVHLMALATVAPPAGESEDSAGGAPPSDQGAPA